MKSYADAYLTTKDNFFAEIIDDIATYVIRDLRHEVFILYCIYSVLKIEHDYIYLFCDFLGRWIL